MINDMVRMLCLSCFLAVLAVGQSMVEPVTQNPTPEARALLKAIARISGRNILSGQLNLAGSASRLSDQVKAVTGKWPALWGADLGDGSAASAREAIISEARRQSASGSTVMLMWQAVRPADGRARLTDAQWSELITPGTKLRKRWEAEVDEVAALLRRLKIARIPVLWQPYLEVRGGASATVYRQLFERIAVHNQVNNLVWVWGAGAAGGGVETYPEAYPGSAYCDVLSTAIQNGDYQQSRYDGLVKLAAGKPLALGPVDAPPTPAILNQQPLWTWFMMGADATSRGAGRDGVEALFSDTRAVHRGSSVLIPEGLQSPAPSPCEPVNGRATAEARALLKTICSLSGKVILSGQHNFPNHLSKWSEHAAEVTGKYPYIWGSDFGFTAEGKDAITGRDAMIEEARRQHAAGSIITLMWHVVRPVDNEPSTWRESVQGKLSDFEWRELMTPGTNLHRRWMAQIDTAAGHLKKLQDAKIPVLWRPYHEANGNWFWWGGRKGESGFAALYRMTYDRMVNHHHLDNLLWVWNSNAPNKNAGPYADFYPGPQYCDILATDVYGEFLRSHYFDLLELANGKPVALGEVGRVPTPAILREQPRWAWFMIWADLFDRNPVDAVKGLFNDPRTVSRGDSLRVGPSAQ